MERIRYVQIAAALVAILILGAALYNYVYLPSLPQELTKIKIATPVAPKDGFWEYQYAADAGMYREEGLEVEILIVRTPGEVAQALLSGDVDAALNVDSTIASYLAGAEEVKVVSVMMRPSFALVVKAEVNSIQDVKSVAIPGRGSAADVMTREYLLQHGLEPDVDVSFQYLAIPTTLPALLAGEVDGIAAGTNAYPALSSGEAKILFQYAKEFPQWCQSGLSVSEKTITERPQIVKGLVRALYRSQTDLMQDKENAMDYAINTLELDEDYATFVYEFAFEGKYGVATKITPDMPVADLEWNLQILAKQMGVPAKPIEGCIDTTFMDEVQKELS